MNKATNNHNSFFHDDTVKLLNEELSKEDVKSRKGTGGQQLSYIASWHAINEANRIFGFGNWSTEIMHIHQADKTIYEKPPYKAGDTPKEMVSVSYTCQLKLTVSNGTRITAHEDMGFGNGVAGNNAYGIGSVIELATKEATTDALKRCLRYYGNKFGLSLYDKDDKPQALAEIEAARVVTEDQLSELRSLYEARQIDDEWVLVALHAENYPHDSLEVMRFDWYQMAFQITHDYKFDELEREAYEADIEKVIGLLKSSANVNMMKALFAEAWKKTGKYDDKERQLEVTKIYEELKSTFEDKK